MQRTSLGGSLNKLWPGLLIAVVLSVSCGGKSEGSARELGEETASGSTASSRAGASSGVQEVTTERLQATIDTAAQRVEGRFERLRFSAQRTGAEQAKANFERIENQTLVAVISGPESGYLEWQGTQLDGFGPLSADEAEVFAHLASRFNHERLALIPLDLACQAGADDLDPAVGAALLLPWQMLIKYRGSETEIEIDAAASASYCQHLRRPLEAVDRERIASPSVVALTMEQPMPMATGFFPLDSLGVANERPSNE